MIDAVRSALAWRAVRDAVSRRSPIALEAEPRSRSLLLVLPTDEDGQRAAWDLVRAVDLEASRVQPVGLGSTGVAVPDAFAGRVEVVGDEALDWRRLPKASWRDRLWASRPEVAVNLAEPDLLAAAILVGAAPAAVRIGRHDPAREPCYDLMVQGPPSAAAAAGALGRLLRLLDPPVLPIR